MIGRRRNKGRTKSSNDVVSLEKNNDAHFVRNFFIAAMIAVVVCSPSVVIAAPAMIGHAFGTIVAINAFGAKSLMGVMIVFALIQSAVASHVEDDDAAHEANVSGPVEENDPDAVHEVDRINAAVLLAWLVTAVVIVALITGASADFGRHNHATGDGAAAASSVDMELGHQGNASCTSNSAAPKFNCKNCNFENPCERMNFEIQGTSETVCVSCPDCKQMLWHCCGCGGQWWKTKPEVIKKKWSAEKMAMEHSCGGDHDRQTKRPRLGGRDGIAEEGNEAGPSKFKCVGCGHSPLNQISRKESVVELSCPTCHAEVFQCCHCGFSKSTANAKDICVSARSGRSLFVLVKKHISRCHKNELEDSTWKDDCCGPLELGSDLVDVFQEESGPDGCCGPVELGSDLVGALQEESGPMDCDELDEESDDGDTEVGETPEDIFEACLLSQFKAERQEEQADADNYVAEILHFDPNDNVLGSEWCNYVPMQFSECDEDAHDFDDFAMFDFRPDADAEKEKRKCQNQLYFFQKYLCRREAEKDEATGKTQEVKDSDLNDDDRRTNALHKAIMKFAGGFRGLLGRSFHIERENENATATPEATDLGFRLFDLVVQMKGTLCERFCRYNEAWWKYYNVTCARKFDNFKVPMNIGDLRRYFTRGPNSVIANFPAPRVYEVAKHACVSLKEVFLIYAGHGAAFNFRRQGCGTENREGLNGTQAMDELVEEVEQRMKDAGVDEKKRKQTKIGWMIFWSDSFLNSFIKQKDNSVWILTVTICPPENMKSSGRYTYILAIGKSDADHSEVIDHFLEEADKLMKGFDCFFGATNKIEHVALGTLCWSADRPERQSITHTRKEGHYGRVTGWAVNVSQEFLPACKRCYTSLIQGLIGVDGEKVQEEAIFSQCNKCCNWSFKTNPRQSKSGKIVYLQEADTTGKHYPSTYPEDAPEKMPEKRQAGMDSLPPVQLSKEFVVQAIRSGYYGVRLGKWTKQNLEEYFRTCNIKTSTAHQIHEKAIEHKESDKDSNKRPTHASLVASASDTVPRILRTVNCWERFRFPNVPMHGLGHGIIPDVMDIVHSVFKKYGKLASFIHFANATLSDVASFRLDYCKLKILPKAAWVGENSMGYMRLMSYLYGMFLLNNPLGKSEEARITVDFLKCFVNSFQAYVSLLMTKNPVEPAMLENHMKLFMSAAHYLHKCHGKLNMKKNGNSGPRKGSNSDQKNPRFVDTCSVDSLRKIGEKMGYKNLTGDLTKGVLIKRLLTPALKKMLQMTSELVDKEPQKTANLKQRLQGVRKKDDLLRVVHDAFWSDDENASNDEAPEEWHGVEKEENMCWVRGNWLSFMANMSTQVQYLGQLHLIW